MANRRGYPSRSLRSSGANRRKVSWSLGPVGHFAVSGNSTALFVTGAAAGLDDLTVVRVRGMVQVELNSVAAALDGFQRIGFGICNVTENAFGAGVGSVPAPLDDIGWDGWLWHWSGVLITASATLTNAEGVSSRTIIIDNKAMRKTHLSDVLVGVGQFSGEVGTAVVGVHMETRILDMLP